MRNTLVSLFAIAAFFLAFVCMSTVSRAQFSSDPNFYFEFGAFEPLTSTSHADTYKIIVGKPIQLLTLSMKSSGEADAGNMHLPGSGILLNLSSAFVLNTVNDSTELSFSAIFIPPLPAGEYLATRVEFGFVEGYFHDTMATATGTFADGRDFSVLMPAGFIPEPTSAMLSVLAFGLVSCSRVRKKMID